MKIEELIPYLKDGWVAMQDDGTWCWYLSKPYIQKERIIGDAFWDNTDDYSEDIDYVPLQGCFDIDPVEDWEKSLIEIKNGKRV